MKRDALPKDFESLRDQKHELHGFAVIDENFGELGAVEEILENPGQSLIKVKGEKHGFLIPFVDEFVKEISIPATTIFVAIPQSLYDLTNNEG